MGLGITQVEATDFLQHDGIGIAHASLLQVEDVAAPRQVCLLRQELRVEGEGVVGHTVEVEEFMMDGEDFAEISFPKNKSKNVYHFQIFLLIL